MAYVSTVDYGETYITVDLSGLSQAQNKYGGFRFRINGGSWNSVSVQSGYTGYDSPNYTFYGLSCGNSYYIEGEAYTNAWYPADAKWASTASCPLPPKTATPTGFSMSATSSSEIKFNWNSVSGASSYEVAIYSPISSSRSASSSPFYWGGLSPSTTYYGYVRAYSSAGGWSDWSSYTYATTLAATKTATPTGFIGNATTSNEIYFSWNGVSGATSYEVQIYSPISDTK